ncbi:hypothetical protein PUNSTDRAFT_135161 [Punctularia strigosozonata HHB-11173 SS5]|uniref:uncharacterized protein n=1 Tax=Punctularia strigosozonata (strain HHB-11173) TaxID=741275 RepID=UPI000441627C|nr:uncharacterized protein PUNSTDRAFT_135161 [Punctularia strigosozonata HHB-11173 SS5]EIN07643.1 hypothetical protein PUNSTDRAFT_135161 [Punctularia strigosozonata HHB-11173 SS5]
MSTKQFWFPPLPNSEILDALSGWGLSISNEQLVKPTSDFVLGVYSFCLRHVTGLGSDELHDCIQKGLSIHDDPTVDMYSHAMARNVLCYHITRFANAARITDFSTSDIAFPKAERTKYILSAFINFIRFIEGVTPFVETVRSKSATIIHERAMVAEELDDAQRRLRDIRAQREKDEPQMAILREENDVITQRLLAFKAKQEGIVQKHDAIRAEKAQYADSKRQVTDQVISLESAVDRTKARIVQSPERIKRTITVMSHDVHEEKRVVAANEAKSRDLQAKINMISTIEKDVLSCLEQLQTIEKEMYLVEAAQKQLADLKDQQIDKESEKKSLYSKRDRMNQQLTNAYEKLERAQRQAESKRLQGQQMFERLQREYEEMVQERSENAKYQEEIGSQADEVERQRAEHLKTSEAELNQLLSEYWKLRFDVDVYMEGLATKLGLETRR